MGSYSSCQPMSLLLSFLFLERALLISLSPLSGGSLSPFLESACLFPTRFRNNVWRCHTQNQV